MLDTSTTGLLIIDVQGKLAELMHESEALFNRLKVLIQGAKILDLPIVWIEQIPEKLGATRPEIAELLPGQALAKSTFSGFGTPEIEQTIRGAGRQQWLVAGIETHVCVYQTVCDLLVRSYDVHLVTDALSSRTLDNKVLALEKMSRLGAQLTSVEMALFELQKNAEGPVFKQLIQIIK